VNGSEVSCVGGRALHYHEPGPFTSRLRSVNTPRVSLAATLRRAVGERWRWWLPPALLVAVAITQPVLVHRAHLTPWKGGGFGMFASTDGAAFRRVRMIVDRGGRSEEVESSPSLDTLELQARLFPSDRRLRRLAAALVARERRRGQPAASVRLEVWRTTFAGPGLLPIEEPIGSLVYRVE